MRHMLLVSVLALFLATCASAQSASAPANPSGTAGQGDKQSNAASATQDNSGVSGDQVTKPAGVKTSSVTGCLSGPDAEGHFVLRSMQYRSGVEILGPNDLGTAAGQKVKLTGQWMPVNESQSQPAQKNMRRFQATTFDLMADKCPPPAEATPVSKTKQKQQKAAASQKAGNNPQ